LFPAHDLISLSATGKTNVYSQESLKKYSSGEHWKAGWLIKFDLYIFLKLSNDSEDVMLKACDVYIYKY